LGFKKKDGASLSQLFSISRVCANHQCGHLDSSANISIVKETVVLDDSNAKLYPQINGNADLESGNETIG